MATVFVVILASFSSSLLLPTGTFARNSVNYADGTIDKDSYDWSPQRIDATTLKLIGLNMIQACEQTSATGCQLRGSRIDVALNLTLKSQDTQNGIDTWQVSSVTLSKGHVDYSNGDGSIEIYNSGHAVRVKGTKGETLDTADYSTSSSFSGYTIRVNTKESSANGELRIVMLNNGREIGWDMGNFPSLLDSFGALVARDDQGISAIAYNKSGGKNDGTPQTNDDWRQFFSDCIDDIPENKNLFPKIVITDNGDKPPTVFVKKYAVANCKFLMPDITFTFSSPIRFSMNGASFTLSFPGSVIKTATISSATSDGLPDQDLVDNLPLDVASLFKYVVNRIAMPPGCTQPVVYPNDNGGAYTNTRPEIACIYTKEDGWLAKWNTFWPKPDECSFGGIFAFTKGLGYVFEQMITCLVTSIMSAALDWISQRVNDAAGLSWIDNQRQAVFRGYYSYHYG